MGAEGVEDCISGFGSSGRIDCRLKALICCCRLVVSADAIDRDNHMFARCSWLRGLNAAATLVNEVPGVSRYKTDRSLFRGPSRAVCYTQKRRLCASPSEFILNPFYSEVLMAQAASLQPGQIRHLLRVTPTTSRHPERDTLVLLLGLTAGMQVTEIAQIEVQDVLFPSGALREEVSLRAAITKGCRQRCIYLSHAKAIEALERYLDFRIARRLRTIDDPSRY